MDFIILLALFIGMSFGVVVVFYVRVKIPEMAKRIAEAMRRP